MNGDRFDNLTRSMASTVSRRDALKIFAAGLAGLLTGLYKSDTGSAFSVSEAAADPIPDYSPCPVGVGGAPFLTDPKIQSGAKCRGACGPDCQNEEYKTRPDIQLCVTGEDGRSYTCIYRHVISMGTAQGCREHDDCYDKCVEEEGETSINGPCHRGCDVVCFKDYNPLRCLSWKEGICASKQLGYICDLEPIWFSDPPLVVACDACSPCEGSHCAPGCPDCTECNPQTGKCEPVDCGSPCLECKNNSCQLKDCPICTECNPQTGACESPFGAAFAVALQQACGNQCCGACEDCVNGSCQPKTCPDCTECNPQTGTCDPVDCACQGITCDDCMHCENGLCVRTCSDTEVCCGNQCINPSEFRCCGSQTLNAQYPCPWGTECCAGSLACCDTTTSLCCGGQCVTYGPDNCGGCRPCGPGQQCCRGPEGQIYGCADSC